MVIGNVGTVARIRPRREEILGALNATIGKFLRGAR
jgi:hypothetical protein